MNKNSNKKVSKIFILFCISFISFTIKTEILKYSVEFTAPLNTLNSPDYPFTPVVHFNDSTYLVYVDSNNRPLVTQKSCNGNVITVPLDSNPDYTAFPDGHHRFSMGVDKYGYIHITGDMHFYPNVPSNYLPKRYQNQTILYWVSNAPNDVAAGFTFAGGLNASTAIPGTDWVTHYFFNDNNNELYFTSMVGAVSNPCCPLTGSLGVGLYKYNADKKSWTNIGNTVPFNSLYPDGTQYNKVFYWEYSGWGSPAGQAQWFNNYWPSFQFDRDNTLHFSLSVNVSLNIAGPSCVIYAKSYDGGYTWYKANNDLIPGLPLRGVNTASNAADIVQNFTTPIGVQSDVIADKFGNPLVNIQPNWYTYTWFNFNGKDWDSNSTSQTQFWGNRGLIDKNGKIILNAAERIAYRIVDSLYSKSAAYLLGDLVDKYNLKQIVFIKNRLTKPGTFHALGISEASNTIYVLKFNFEVGTLPCSWSYKDIGNDILFGGITDYDNDNETFTIRSATSGFDNGLSDSVHFAYRPLKGDGTVIARITSQTPIQFIKGSTTGVMMRQSLNVNSPFMYMSIGITPEAQLYFRNSFTSNSETAITFGINVLAPYWVAVVRNGNMFSGFVSQDGVSWIQVGKTQNIQMDETIFVGLGSASTHTQDTFVSTVDNVSILKDSGFINASITGTTGGTGVTGESGSSTGSTGRTGTTGTSSVTATLSPTGVNVNVNI